MSALLLALVITGGTFAYSYNTRSTNIVAVGKGGDFARVSLNTSINSTWAVFGNYRGSIPSGTLFNISTTSANYTGDLVATVYLANGDQLSHVYKVFGLFIEARYPRGQKVNINDDGVVDANDYILLTLQNQSGHMYIRQTVPDTYTIMLQSGYYISHRWGAGWPSGYQSPIIYCDVAPRPR